MQTMLESKSEVVSAALEGSPAPALWNRGKLIAHLEERVRWYEANGNYPRAAIRAVAAEAGLHPLRVKRLAVGFPEA